jgi:peptidoglycan hydrolase CwlO-like protein
MDNIESQIICNLQYQLDALQKDNLNYLSVISDLENNVNNVNNLQNEITQKNKEIEKLNELIKSKEQIIADVNKRNESNNIFSKVFKALSVKRLKTKNIIKIGRKLSNRKSKVFSDNNSVKIFINF